MSKPNPWADLSEVTRDLLPPIAVLREQAQMLSEGTSGVVQGVVSSDSEAGRGTILHRFHATVPALDNFSIELVRAWHPVTLYPCEVYTDLIGSWTNSVSCKDAAQLEEVLIQIAQHADIRKVVGALLVQVTPT